VEHRSMYYIMMKFEFFLNKLGLNFTKKTIQHLYKYINRFER